MPRFSLVGTIIVAVAAISVSSCASRRDSTTSASASPQQSQRLSTATLTFRTLEDGKDAKSAVSVQLVRNGNELGADAMTSGTEFDDNTTAAPLIMSVRGPFDRDDTRSGQLRLRLSPDGDDTWTFNVGLTLRFSDETQQNYSWTAVRLDEKAPERTLVLSGAQVQ
jgi:hypothetical protein